MAATKLHNALKNKAMLQTHCWAAINISNHSLQTPLLPRIEKVGFLLLKQHSERVCTTLPITRNVLADDHGTCNPAEVKHVGLKDGLARELPRISKTGFRFLLRKRTEWASFALKNSFASQGDYLIQRRRKEIPTEDKAINSYGTRLGSYILPWVSQTLCFWMPIAERAPQSAISIHALWVDFSEDRQLSSLETMLVRTGGKWEIF